MAEDPAYTAAYECLTKAATRDRQRGLYPASTLRDDAYRRRAAREIVAELTARRAVHGDEYIEKVAWGGPGGARFAVSNAVSLERGITLGGVLSDAIQDAAIAMLRRPAPAVTPEPAAAAPQDCGRRASNPWGTCGPCENEATGRDEEGDER